jgi:cardiolipin synthase A/B
MRLAALLIVAGLLLSGCAPWSSPGSVHESTTCLDSLGDFPAAVTGVFVEPDDGYEPVLDEIEAARCTLDLNMYMLTDEPIFESLIAAVDRGVDVRVILEQHPFGMFGDQQEAFDRLLDIGAEVQWEPKRFQFSHAKYLIVDGRVALIMNQNFTGSAFSSNREFGVITTSPDEVRHARAIFDADWTDEVDESIDGPLLVSPDNSRERLLGLIGAATESIDFYAELIRDEEVLQALEDAVARGVRVRLIMNASLDDEDVESVAELARNGVEVRLMRAVYIHSKTMIIDEDVAVVGSINYSMTSLDRNREVAMLVDNPALVSRITAVYERDWIRSEPVVMP